MILKFTIQGPYDGTKKQFAGQDELEAAAAKMLGSRPADWLDIVATEGGRMTFRAEIPVTWADEYPGDEIQENSFFLSWEW